MGLSFTAKVETGYELIKAGEYEMILKLEWDKTLNGDKYMKGVFTIRDDVEQDHAGRLIFENIYANDKGEFDERRINALLSTIENPKCDFEDYDELIQYLNGKLLRAEVGIKKANPDKPTEKDKNMVKYWTFKPTNYPEYTQKLQTATGFTVVKNQTEITDEDLPF